MSWIPQRMPLRRRLVLPSIPWFPGVSVMRLTLGISSLFHSWYKTEHVLPTPISGVEEGCVYFNGEEYAVSPSPPPTQASPSLPPAWSAPSCSYELQYYYQLIVWVGYHKRLRLFSVCFWQPDRLACAGQTTCWISQNTPLWRWTPARCSMCSDFLTSGPSLTSILIHLVWWKTRSHALYVLEPFVSISALHTEQKIFDLEIIPLFCTFQIVRRR